MLEIDERARVVLELARRGLSPSLVDETRVRAALTRALAAEPALRVPGERLHDRSSGVNIGSAAPAPPPATRWLSRLAVLAAVIAAGGIGYHLGRRSGLEERTPVVVVSTPVTPATVPTAVSRERAVPAPAEQEEEDLVIEEIPMTAQPRSAADALRSAPPSGAPPKSNKIDEEILQMRRVERALRSNNPRLALALLEDLDRAVPRGKLLEERAAAGVIARCELGFGAGQAMAEDFAKRRPSSVYLPRVRRACGVPP
jgi:hypothetical protein